MSFKAAAAEDHPVSFVAVIVVPFGRAPFPPGCTQNAPADRSRFKSNMSPVYPGGSGETEHGVWLPNFENNMTRQMLAPFSPMM